MWLKSSSHYKVPAAMIIASLVAIGFLGFSQAGDIGAQKLIQFAGTQALMQWPIGLLVIFIAGRLFAFDFGTFGTVSLKVLAISLFEEAVVMALGLLAGIPPASLISTAVSFVLFLFLVMILFETTGAETWIVAGVTLAVSFGLSHYLHPDAPRQIQKSGGVHHAAQIRAKRSAAKRKAAAGRASSGATPNVN